MMTEQLEDLYLGKNQVIKFLKTIEEYEPIRKSKSPMSLEAWQVYFAFIYYTCVRPGAEALRVQKKHINLDSNIVTLQNYKGGFHKTTIPPPLQKPLAKYIKNLKDEDFIFKGTRVTFWQYTKDIGHLSKIKYFEEFAIREIEGLYTYVFKHAYIQRLEFEGCPPSLISIKSRHRPDGRMSRQTVNYAKSLRGLKIWEAQNITETLPI